MKSNDKKEKEPKNKNEQNNDNDNACAIKTLIALSSKKQRKTKEKSLIQKQFLLDKLNTDLSDEQNSNFKHHDLSSPMYRPIFSHGENVAKYTKLLFEQLQSLHNLPSNWLDILLTAAKYHDIGIIVSANSHHKHSYTRIINDYNLPIENKEREMVALLARYHRKSLPTKDHSEFAKLSHTDQDELCKAASILRMADALDYGHQGIIDDLKVIIHSDHIEIICYSQRDISFEIERIVKKGDLFIRTFRKEIRCNQA